ncbi:methionyl-tRNA formyltransferase [Purpureocillium lilacinum]|uniref:methionyl-tRNA formyltransferase n=1 Tax=Purpureocillium lilacinum TaxID=33203 RepID=A0A179GAK1_PURLI|nr:methionyl-tRNA formyltransferase [Purpureocillium lilacinum]
MHPPPSTPAPRRFLLAKRNTQRGGGTQPQTQPPPPLSQQQPQQHQRTPGAPSHSQFQSTPRFGSSSVLRSTQRKGLDIEDVVDVEDEEDEGAQDEDEVEGDSDAVIPKDEEDAHPWDSIEVESDGVVSASQDDVMAQANEEDPDAASMDAIIDVDSQQDGTTQDSQEGSEDMDLPDSADESRHSPSERTANRDRTRAVRDRAQQPVFRPAPRFKPLADADDAVGEGLPAAFSPQRRGARYVPGGLAAELQGWLSEVKGWESHDVQGADSSGGSRGSRPSREFLVEEVRPGRRMYLVRARPRGIGGIGGGEDPAQETTAPSRSIILAGDGKLTGLGRRAMVGVGSAVGVAGPVWDVDIKGETWTVACDWSNDNPDMTPPTIRPVLGLLHHAHHPYQLHHQQQLQRLAAAGGTLLTLITAWNGHSQPRRPFSSSSPCRREQQQEQQQQQQQQQQRRAAPSSSDPLRILFCGSDDFSVASLRALHAERARDPSLVSALDVMVLPPRRTGRGLKTLREVPCRAVAEELGLRVHQRETFRNWDLPEGTNLVVVVSFGLFVPSRILNSAKYGGLNVHPSFLPDLRGPAPIHHALLRGDSHIGITLQTLDDKQFDHGAILAQTPRPGIPVRPDAPLQEVIQDAAARGAELLVQGLRDGLHVPPHRTLEQQSAPPQGEPLAHAPKVTKADAQIDWDAWTSGQEFARRARVFGSVWTHAVNDAGLEKRILFLDVEPMGVGNAGGARGFSGGEEVMVEFAHDDGTGEDWATHLRRVVVDEDSGACAVSIGAGVGEGDSEGAEDAERREWLLVRRVKVDGKKEQKAATGLRPFLRRPPL